MNGGQLLGDYLFWGNGDLGDIFMNGGAGNYFARFVHDPDDYELNG